jgi:hypothetical protein
MTYHQHIGIDYSGASSPIHARPNLKICRSFAANQPALVQPPNKGHWSRASAYAWITGLLDEGSDEPVLIGLDHGFSWPQTYLDALNLKNWQQVLDNVEIHFGSLRDLQINGNVDLKSFEAFESDLRLTEERTVAAKPVFDFRPHGVAHSTLAGLPWISLLRKQFGKKIHFWPFDGWTPPDDKHCIVEVYPTLFRRRYAADTKGMDGDSRDAYCACRWIQEADQNGWLATYFHPQLTATQDARARREGWILGVCDTVVPNATCTELN